MFTVHEPVQYESEGSGGCSYNSDDEDCYSDSDSDEDNYYYQYYEGSGSGDDSDEEIREEKPAQKVVKESKNEDEENWPPWVTAKPENNDEIEVVENEIIKPKPRQPSFSGTASKSQKVNGLLFAILAFVMLWVEKSQKSNF